MILQYLKKVVVAVLAFTLLSSCATYHITVMDEEGKVIKEHDTKKMYVGTGAFVPDAVLDPLVMTVSLFYPLPSMKTNLSVGGGIDLPRYISKMASLAPTPLVGSSGGSTGDWIIFHDDQGEIVSYNGFSYSISRKSKINLK